MEEVGGLHMNTAALLALLGDLYAQVIAAQQKIAELEQKLAALEEKGS